MKKYFAILMACTTTYTYAQKIKIESIPSQQKAVVTINGKPFTQFNYPDSLPKPFLWPIIAAGGENITRGFPIQPRANEPIDHPHHIGLWLNYENVNGIDFWNNSYAIPAAEKNKYGHIQNVNITSIKNGNEASLAYTAQWMNITNEVLLNESTSYIFSTSGNAIIIDRITTLTAAKDVALPDVKDGLLGLRVSHELELPTKDARQFTDTHGNITTVERNDNSVTGNYINSNGDSGDSAWGKRAAWCMLYGKSGNDTISIAIIDHPKNVGYPTCWHARGYGLFAANPLGQKIFTNGKQTLNFSLKKDESVTFRFRIVINSENKKLSKQQVDDMTKSFSAKYSN